MDAKERFPHLLYFYISIYLYIGMVWQCHEVWKCLKKLEDKYFISKIFIDPIDLGDAAKRKRVYIILIRKRVAIDDVQSHAALEQQLERVLAKIQLPAAQCKPNPCLGVNSCFFSSCFWWCGVSKSIFLISFNCNQIKIVVNSQFAGVSSCSLMVTHKFSVT